jgi:uncharacterized protein involved in tolerance to divalent cations
MAICYQQSHREVLGIDILMGCIHYSCCNQMSDCKSLASWRDYWVEKEEQKMISNTYNTQDICSISKALYICKEREDRHAFRLAKA